MTLDRRSLLGWMGAGAAGSMAGPTVAGTAPSAVSFRHGVASGDPAPRSVVFWTRVTPEDRASGDIDVVLEVATDADFSRIVHRATGLRARAERDFTVKHDLDGQGLEPGTDYHYRFIANGVTSPVGRTRTLALGALAEARLAVVSCQLYPGGLYNAYDAIARLEQVDAVVHLGDYIYEYGGGPDDYGMETGRALNRLPDPPHEIVSLDDYRRRHAQYKTDPDLQAAHARAPFICVWDDHEVANDTWNTGAQNHQPATEGTFVTRKAAALRAYFEWMPIRDPAPGTMQEAIQRSFHFGDLASLMMVETRLQGRIRQLSYGSDMSFSAGPDGRPVPDVEAFEALRHGADRDLLGTPQREWLDRELATSKAAGRPWQVLGNQVVMARVAGPNIAAMASPAEVAGMLAGMAPDVRAQVEQAAVLFSHGLPFNLDSWDGYPAGRERLYETFKAAGVQPIVLAGDSHAFWINELKDDAGERRAVEFGTSGISSPSPGDALGDFPLGAALAGTNPEVVFCDQTAKGFVLLTLTPDSARADLMAVSTILAKPYQLRTVTAYALAAGPDATGTRIAV
ncbi:MAG: alkaline phosphatase D family protein [Brevundimonas sp.]